MKITKDKDFTYITAEPGFQLVSCNKNRGGIVCYHQYGETRREDKDFSNTLDGKDWWYYAEIPFYEYGHIIYEEDVDSIKMRYRIIEYDSDPRRERVGSIKYMSTKEYHVECQDYNEPDKLKWDYRHGRCQNLDEAMMQLRRDIIFFQYCDKCKKNTKHRETLCCLTRSEFVFNDDKEFEDIREWHNRGHHNCLTGLLINETKMLYSRSYKECEDLLNKQYQLCKREIEYRHYRPEEYSLQDWTTEEEREKNTGRINIAFDYTYREPKDSTSKFKYRTIFYDIDVLEDGLSTKKD